jgi:alkaline phosphatase D
LTSVITGAINTLLILLAADFLFTPVIDSATDVIFTRLGAVYPDAVKVVVRYPLSGANATEHNVLILWRPATASVVEPWTDGPTLHLQPEFDWTNTTKLTKLWPSTEYECTYTLLLLLFCASPPCPDVLAHTNRTVLPYPASPIRFRTFPDSRLPTGSHFRFVVSSCVKPNFPYAPFQGRRIRGFDLLADYLFAEPTTIDTPGAVAYVKANDNVTESPVPLEDNIGIKTNVSVPEVVPAPLEVKHGDVAPTEFMLFLVRGCRFPHQYGILTYHRATSSTPTSHTTTAIRSTHTVVCTDATITVLASVKSLSDFVRL